MRRQHILAKATMKLLLGIALGAVGLGLLGALFGGTAGVQNGVMFGAMFGCLGGVMAAAAELFTGGADAGMMVSRGLGKRQWEDWNTPEEQSKGRRAR